MTGKSTETSDLGNVQIGWTQQSSKVWTARIGETIYGVLYYCAEEQLPAGFCLALKGSPDDHLLLHEDVYCQPIGGLEDSAKALEQAGDLIALRSIEHRVSGFAAFSATKMLVLTGPDREHALETEWFSCGTGGDGSPYAFIAVDGGEILAVLSWVDAGRISEDGEAGYYLALANESTRIHRLDTAPDGGRISEQLDLPDAIAVASAWITEDPA